MKPENTLTDLELKQGNAADTTDENDAFYDDDREDLPFTDQADPTKLPDGNEERLFSFIKKAKKEEKFEKAKAALKEKQRAAIKKLLEHTGGNIPELYNKVNEELRALMGADKKLDFAKTLDFTQENASFRIPRFSESFNLDGATDYFGMTVPEQELLFDRIGLFKGIVVDHSKDTPVEQGYRNAVKFTADANELTKAVNVFYKKPRLSGFFETTYALDESQKKTQETGIFNMAFGLSVDYNYYFTSAAVRAGFAYGKERLAEKNLHVKKIAITSNYFLPKIELSFDTLQACADSSLVKHLEAIFADENTNTTAKFEKINTILAHYGHFVPGSFVIGGRLYSSETRKISNAESIENEVTKYEANFHAAVSTLRTEVGIEAKMNKSDGSKAATQEISESQNLKLNAVGGEGAYVNDTPKWVKSTEKYTSWGLVRFDNLVPVIDILPEVLRKKCSNIFSSIVNELTIEEILERNAHYIFYKGYFEKFGTFASPKFYLIKNNLTDNNVLSVSSDGDPVNFTEVLLKPFERKDSQLWYAATDGKIYCKEGYAAANKFVLSLDNDKLVVTMDNYFDNQYWNVGGGMIKNENSGKFLTGKDKTGFEVKDNADHNAKKSAWLLVGEEEFSSGSKKTTENNKKATLVNAAKTLYNNQYITVNETLATKSKKTIMALGNGKLSITHKDKSEKTNTIYSLAIDARAVKLALNDGNLMLYDEKDVFVGMLTNEISGYVNELTLLDNGNLEATDRSGKIIWQSNSVVYATIAHGETDLVLTVHHADFAPDMSYGFMAATVMPYIGADHQLWYVNRNNQIVSKVTYGGKQFALTCDSNGTVSVSELKINNLDQEWKIENFGLIESKNTHKKRLRAAEMGRFVYADHANENWALNLQSENYGLSRPMKINRPVKSHTEDRDYLNFFKSDYPNTINLGLTEIKGKKITGMKIGVSNKKYVLQFLLEDGNQLQTQADGDFSHFTKDITEFQKSPVYLDKAVTHIGLHYISNDKYGLKATKGSTALINKDGGMIKMEKDDKKINFVDLNWAMAGANEHVVGFGLGTDGNRLAPYVLTIPK